MFLSLVRPDRISSPITRRAAVMRSLAGAASGWLMALSSVSLVRRGRTNFWESALAADTLFSMNVAQQAALQQPPEKPPFRPISYATPAIASKVADDGVVRLHSLAPLAPHDPSLAGLFRTAVDLAPARIF